MGGWSIKNSLGVCNPTPQRTPAAHCLRHDIRHWTLRVTYLRSHIFGITLLNALLLADSSQEQDILTRDVQGLPCWVELLDTIETTEENVLQYT